MPPLPIGSAESPIWIDSSADEEAVEGYFFEENPPLPERGENNNDYLFAENPPLPERGVDGNDYIFGENPRLIERGVDGNDYFFGENPRLIERGVDGNDYFFGENSRLIERGVDGNDYFFRENPRLIERGEEGVVFCEENPPLIEGGEEGVVVFEVEDNNDILDELHYHAELQRMLEENNIIIIQPGAAGSGFSGETIQPALGSAEVPICLDCSVEEDAESSINEDAEGSIQEDAEGSIEEDADGLTGQEPVPCHSQSLARRSRRRGVNHPYARPIMRVIGQQRKPNPGPEEDR